jgi:hypothetical protein
MIKFTPAVYRDRGPATTDEATAAATERAAASPVWGNPGHGRALRPIAPDRMPG